VLNLRMTSTVASTLLAAVLASGCGSSSGVCENKISGTEATTYYCQQGALVDEASYEELNGGIGQAVWWSDKSCQDLGYALANGSNEDKQTYMANPTMTQPGSAGTWGGAQGSGGGSDTGPARYQALFNNGYMRFKTAGNGDQCQWTINWENGMIDLSFPSTAPGQVSATVRVRGTRKATPFHSQVGTTNCQPSTETIDISKAFDTVFPYLDWRMTVRPTEVFDMSGGRVDSPQFRGTVTISVVDPTGVSGGNALDMPLTFNRQP
jgi:hypothetical protein